MKNSAATTELEKASATLTEALQFAEKSKATEVQFKIARDACIQRFEYCIELSWKTSMKRLGSQTKFAKPAVREMARADLIDSAETWLQFIEARNLTSHSYDESVAKNLFETIQIFSAELTKLIQKLRQLD